MRADRRRRIRVLYEDESILVCIKPAGMPVQSDRSRDPDMLTLLRDRIFMETGAEKEPYLAAVHRLDRPVGGLMVFARTKEAAAALSEQIQKFEFEKDYQAVVCGEPEEPEGVMEDELLADPVTNMTKVVSPGTPGARHALLEYEVIDVVETEEGLLSWVLVILHTGRHHQIRAQFAHRGLPLYGDARYNPAFAGKKGSGKCFAGVGLYATRLAFCHPVTGEKMVYKTEPEGKAFDLLDVEAY